MESFFTKNRKALMLLSGNIFFLSILLLILEKLTFINISIFINLNFLIFTIITLPFIWFFFFIKKDEEYYKIKFEPYFRYGFLFILFLIFLNFLKFEFVNNIYFIKIINNFLKNHYLVVNHISFCFIFFTIYFNFKKIKENLKEENYYSNQKKEKRKKEFCDKFQKINKIPVIKKIIKLIYIEGYLYSFFVIILIIIGFAIRLYNLGELSLWWDELYTGTYVKRIMEVGIPSFPSEFGYYWRGIAYHYFVVMFVFLFGNTEFWLRFPSVLFGMGIVVISFLFAKKINKNVALIVLAFLTFSTYNIEYSRFARFYIMNSFLFMIAIYFFWKGFFKNNLKYKILSIIIFFIMVHTVQLGVLFVSLWIVWSIYSLKVFIFEKEKLNFIKENLINLFFIVISIIIFFVNNIFEKLFTKKINLNKAINVFDVNNITQPESWDYFKYPQWELIKFFNQNYIPIIFLSICLFIFLFSFFSIKKEKLKDISFFNYLFFILIISNIIYEVGNRNVIGARIFLFAESLIVIFSIISIFIFMKIIKEKVALIITTLIFIFLFFSINPIFYKRISFKYGDNLINDSFRSTHVIAYRSDYETTYEYLKKNKKESDIWINVMTPTGNYFVYQNLPNYVFNQSYRWNTDSFFKNNYFIEPTSGAILINNVDDIKKIISDNPNKKIWLLVNGGSVNILSTTHVKKDLLNFLEEKKDKLVYRSSDKTSFILLFN